MRSRTLLAALALCFSIGSVAAQTAPAHATLRDDQIAHLKQVGHLAISARLAWLRTLEAIADHAAHLTPGHAATLRSQLGSASSGLTSLDAKIQADSDLATLRTDVQTIVTGYRIYVLVTPKTHITIAADRIAWIADRFDPVATKLRTAIDRAKAAGKDTSAAEHALGDLRAKVSAAKSLVAPVPGNVLGLTASGYPDNRSTLMSARTSLGTARDDLRAARADVATAVESLR